MADLLRDFWICETGTGQQVDQLHDRYMMMMSMYIYLYKMWNVNLYCNVMCYLFSKFILFPFWAFRFFQSAVT